MLSRLRGRLVLLVLFALLPALALILYTAREHRQAVTAAAREEALRLARLIADEQDVVLDGAKQLLAGLAKLPVVREQDAAACDALLASVSKEFPFYTNIAAVTPGGDIFCSAVPRARPVNVADRGYFQRALQTRGFALSEFLIGRTTGKPSLTLAYPALDQRGAVKAVLFVGLDLDWMNRLIGQIRLPEGATFTVHDRQGVILARSPDPATWIGKSVPEAPVVRAPLARGEGTIDAEGLDGVERLYGFMPLFRRVEAMPSAYVAVGFPKHAVVARANRILARDLAVLGLVTAAVVLMAWIGGDLFVLRRINRLVATAERLAEGDLGARSGLARGRDELGHLARAFDAMAHALEARQSALVATTETLRETNQRLSTIVETSPLAIWTLDPEGRVTAWNPAAERIFGWRRDEVLGRPHPVIPEDRQEEFRAILARLLRGETLLGLELRRRKKDGTPIDIEVSAAPILDPFGIALGAIAVGADITERKRAEAELLRVNRALRVLSACNIELVRATTEPDLLRVICETIVNVGGYRFAWVGFAERDDARTLRPVAHAGHEEGYLELLNVTWGDAQGGGGAVATALRSGQPAVVKDILTDPRFASRRSEAIRRGYASVIALPLVHAERPLGALVIYSSERDAFDAEEVKLLTELANDLAYAIVALRTRAERARVEEELQRQRETLYQSEKLGSMGQLLAGVAHELNNPLSVVLGHALMLRRSTDDGPLAERAEKITQAARRCARIVRNFLALARQQPPERQETRLNQVAEEAAELLAYPLKVDNVEVVLHLAPDLAPIWADPHQLHQVVVNLISNAQQAMRKTGPPRRITLSTGFDSSRSRAFLRVADTGPGIPQEIRNRIFEPFFTTKPPGQGTGLGLALCHGIVEEHGGTIRVESEPGKGAVFTVELPMTAPPAAARGPRAGEAEAVTGKSILVVDDEAEVADILAEMLSADGHSVETAANGIAALEKLAQRSYDLIVSDIRMPELDGPGLYREVAQRHPELLRRFIFVTGDSLTHETSEFLEQTGVVTFEKPFESEKLRTAVRQALQES